MNPRINTCKRKKFCGIRRATTLCVLLPLGCNLAFGQQKDYPDAYKETMVAYKAEGLKVMSVPLPSKSLPKAKKREWVAQHVETMAKYHQKYSDRIKALKPPKQFREVNSSTVAWLKIQAVDSHLWAESIRHLNHKAQLQVIHDGNVHQIDALLRLKQAMKNIGASSEKEDSLIIELQQENKKPLK